MPVEVVRTPLPHAAWDVEVLEGLEPVQGARSSGRVSAPMPVDARRAVQRVVLESAVPTVVDGDALDAARDATSARGRTRCTVLTPHDGEYERLTGHAPGADRIDAARRAGAHGRTRPWC